MKNNEYKEWLEYKKRVKKSIKKNFGIDCNNCHLDFEKWKSEKRKLGKALTLINKSINSIERR